MGKEKPLRERDYPLVVISDTHLGMKNGGRDKLLAFLQNLSCETLVLNGDILDGERFERYPNRQLTLEDIHVIDALNELAASGTKVIYLLGNHEETLRELQLGKKTFGGITFDESHVHTTPAGQRYFIFHGDKLFKGPPPAMPRVINADDTFSDKAIAHLINTVRSICDNEKSVYLGVTFDRAAQKFLGKRFNAATRTVSAFRYFNRFRGDFENDKKAFMKKAQHPITYIENMAERVRHTDGFRNAALAKARKEGYDGIVCGHNHRAELRIEQDGTVYANSGDWVTSYTALALNKNGAWEVLHERDWSVRNTTADTNKKLKAVTEDMVEAIYKIWPSADRKSALSRLRKKGP